MKSEDAFWAVHDGQVDMYFGVNRASGDRSCISVSGAVKK